MKLSDKLLEVCNKHVDPGKNHSMDKLCRGLTRLTNSRLACVFCFCNFIETCLYTVILCTCSFPLGTLMCIELVFVSSYCSNFSSVMVPLQSSLTVTLPIGHGSNQPNHNPFPGEQPTIIKFEDKVRMYKQRQDIIQLRLALL